MEKKENRESKLEWKNEGWWDDFVDWLIVRNKDKLVKRMES